MTDKELLEMAAKAAGIEGKVRQFQKTYDSSTYIGIGKNRWNPLTDDGDALRLAVKLNLTVHQWPDEVCVCNASGTINEDVAKAGDPYAATRRAIVRAAAEIGRNME